MKKFIAAIAAACTFSLLAIPSAAAITQEEAEKSWENWEISINPKPTEAELAAERETLRWTPILENEVGVYAYDREAFSFVKTVGLPAKQRVAGLVKTVFTDKNVKKKLNKDYASKLGKKEKIAYCHLEMLFDVKARTYAVLKTSVYTEENRLVDERQGAAQLAPVPEKSFAEAMLEIAQQYAAETGK